MIEEVYFSKDVEQVFLTRVINIIERAAKNLPTQLGKATEPGQRKHLEKIVDSYLRNRDKPYFGVFTELDPISQSRRYVRIGRAGIFDDSSEAIVINWHTPEGGRFYQLERENDDSFSAANVSIEDDVVVQIYETNSQKALRRRKRIQDPKTGNLQDIIDVIHPDQDDVVRVDHIGPLVVQGGPGTGKTVVALQRLAYLLLKDGGSAFSNPSVLVIGPSSAYTTYVRNFLPSLEIGNVRNEDFLSICMARIPVDQRQQFSNLREERDGFRITKNSANLIRVIQGSIWPKAPEINIETTINFGMGRREKRFFANEELSAIFSELKQRFLSGTISYVQAQDSLCQSIQSGLANEKSTEVAKSARTSDARRTELIETWLLKIGMYSQQDRYLWKNLLDSPRGGRYKRSMSALMNDYYQRDIEVAIEIIAELRAIDTVALRQALEELGAPRKQGNSNLDSGVDETEIVIVEISEIPFEAISGAINNQSVLPEIKQVIERILPNLNPLLLAKSICRGDSELFERALGNNGRAVAARLSEEAISASGGKAYVWSDADLPIVAEILFLVNGNSDFPSYSHVLIDEAQDLTRLQSRVISRYVRDSFVTFVGDTNQATKSGSLASWTAIADEFDVDNLRVESLMHNYRVPQNVYDYARMYLSEDDRVETPSCDLEGGEIKLLSTDQPDALVVLKEEIKRRAIESHRVVVISTDKSLAPQVLEWNISNVQVLTPEDSKGLEVDHTILFQPSRWYKDVGRIRNLMYVVLTRATKSVTIIQHDPDNYGIYEPLNQLDEGQLV